MIPKALYLWINIGTVLVPFIFSFHPKLKFSKHFTSFIKGNLLVAFVFIIWDVFYTKLGVWGFNENYLLGLNIYNLPFEEVLFFIFIPFSCVFTYHSLNLFFDFKWDKSIDEVVILTASIILVTIGVFNINRYYTASAFISLSVVLILSKFFFRIKWFVKFLVAYLILLIPFILVNGLLTGSFIEQPIVWYNNSENLGIRILTIPLDDFFYSFELLFLNVFFYEFFKNRHKSKSSDTLDLQ